MYYLENGALRARTRAKIKKIGETAIENIQMAREVFAGRALGALILPQYKIIRISPLLEEEPDDSEYIRLELDDQDEFARAIEVVRTVAAVVVYRDETTVVVENAQIARQITCPVLSTCESEIITFPFLRIVEAAGVTRETVARLYAAAMNGTLTAEQVTTTLGGVVVVIAWVTNDKSGGVSFKTNEAFVRFEYTKSPEAESVIRALFRVAEAFPAHIVHGQTGQFVAPGWEQVIVLHDNTPVAVLPRPAELFDLLHRTQDVDIDDLEFEDDEDEDED